MLEQRTVSCSHLEGLLPTLVSSTLRYERCGRWTFRSHRQSYRCPDSFWRCLTLSSDLNIMQKSRTGSTVIVFSQTATAFGGILPVWKKHVVSCDSVYKVWGLVCLMVCLIKPVAGVPFWNITITKTQIKSSLEEIQLHVSISVFPKYLSLVCPKNQSNNRMQNERQIWALMNSVLTGSVRTNN